MRELALTAIGRDRPGIVAAISAALLELGGNVEDSQMSILRGHFAVMLLVGVPGERSRDEVAARMEAVREELALEAIAVEEVEELTGPPPAPSHVLTVYGADRPGIVHDVSAALARLGVNVTDLETRLTGGEASPVYVMMLELALGDSSAEAVERALASESGAEGLEISLRELGAEAL